MAASARANADIASKPSAHKRAAALEVAKGSDSRDQSRALIHRCLMPLDEEELALRRYKSQGKRIAAASFIPRVSEDRLLASQCGNRLKAQPSGQRAVPRHCRALLGRKDPVDSCIDAQSTAQEDLVLKSDKMYIPCDTGLPRTAMYGNKVARLRGWHGFECSLEERSRLFIQRIQLADNEWNSGRRPFPKYIQECR
jgi:hypothetical protein